MLVIALLLIVADVVGASQLHLGSSDKSANLPYKTGVAHLGELLRPRVYLYPVSDRFHEGLTRHFLPGEPGLVSDTAAAASVAGGGKVAVAWTNSEIGIQRCLAASPDRATTADAADFFYVPFYPSLCHAAQMAPILFNGTEKMMDACIELGDVLTDVVTAANKSATGQLGNSFLRTHGSTARLSKTGLGQLPTLWRRAGGRDHILPGWLPSYTPYLREETMSAGPIRLLGDFGVVKEPWDKVKGSAYMRRFGYGQTKDLLFPWHLMRDPADAAAPPMDAPRVHFMYYAGSSSTLIAKANRHRVRLARLVEEQPDAMFVEMTARFPPKDVQQQMRNSVFCPAPPGDTQLATRHYDAIVAGCIPVVLTEGRVPLPYDNVLDWSKFAVLLPVDSVYDGSLVRVLRNKTNEEITELRKNVYAVRPYFIISPSCSSPSAVDMLLHQLALQKKSLDAASKLSLDRLQQSADCFARQWGISAAIFLLFFACFAHCGPQALFKP